MFVSIRFVELTKAYELLSDPERKLKYDNYGITEESLNFQQKHDYSQYNRYRTYPPYPLPGVANLLLVRYLVRYLPTYNIGRYLPYLTVGTLQTYIS